MKIQLYSRSTGLVLLLASLAGCGGEPAPSVTDGAATTEAGTLFRYDREYTFVGSRQDPPVVVPFSFSVIDRNDQLERTATGWLARGRTWDRFLDDTTRTSTAGGVWRVVPQGDLQIIAGGPAEIESIRFSRAERRLRLDLDEPLTAWNQGGETRFRLLPGRLMIGAEAIPGHILEVLRVERALPDGWPPGVDFDALFLTSGDSIQLVIAEVLDSNEVDSSYAWLRVGAEERAWSRAEIRWIELTALQEARRDIPIRWSFRVPGSSIHGELEAIGFDPVLGPERAGRRAVEIRYSTVGWLELDGEELPVTGAIRHTQQ